LEASKGKAHAREKPCKTGLGREASFVSGASRGVGGEGGFAGSAALGDRLRSTGFEINQRRDLAFVIGQGASLLFVLLSIGAPRRPPRWRASHTRRVPEGKPPHTENERRRWLRLARFAPAPAGIP
jgi:hypothetical protein